MNEIFELDHAPLAATRQFADLARELGKLSPIDSRQAFNRYCRTASLIWRSSVPSEARVKLPDFEKLSARIGAGGADVIQTGWGGVVITLRHPPRIDKYLVVKKNGYLALEKHAQKDERVEVKEGVGLLLWRQFSGQPLVVTDLRKGDQFHFKPGVEHCVIGTEDLLLFERSTDPKGMDQDLIYLYEPSAPS